MTPELRAILEDYARWYRDPNSQCPECPHGPQWHDDPSGCTRMTDGWCECERVYMLPEQAFLEMPKFLGQS